MEERNQKNSHIIFTYYSSGDMVGEKEHGAWDYLGYSFPQRENKRETSKNKFIRSQMSWHRSERRKWKALWTTSISVFHSESSHVCMQMETPCLLVQSFWALSWCFMFWRSLFAVIMQNFPGVSNELIDMLMRLRWNLKESCMLSFLYIICKPQHAL